MSDHLIEMIQDADLLEIDGFSIRNFALDESELETGHQDAVVIELKAEDERNIYNWAFTREELSNARYDAAQEGWIIWDGQHECLLRLFRLLPMKPEQKTSDA